MIVYKLFNLRANGTLGPLFINRKQVIPVGEWLAAEDRPTKGYAQRPGWHAGMLPDAKHLTERGRVWCACEVLGIEYRQASHPEQFRKQGDMPSLPVAGWYRWKRPANQGGEWIIASHLRVLDILTPQQVDRINALAKDSV